jgi:hypothetical protein
VCHIFIFFVESDNFTIDGLVSVKSTKVLNSTSQVETKVKKFNQLLDETFEKSFIPMGDELVEFELKDEEEENKNVIHDVVETL